MNTIKEDFEMMLFQWLVDNPESSREILIDLMIDSYEQEDDLNKWEKCMLVYLLTINI